MRLVAAEVSSSPATTDSSRGQNFQRPRLHSLPATPVNLRTVTWLSSGYPRCDGADVAARGAAAPTVAATGGMVVEPHVPTC